LPASLAKDMIINIINNNHYSKNKMLGTSGVPSFGKFYKEGKTCYGIIWGDEQNEENMEKLYKCVQQDLLTVSKIEPSQYKERVFYKIKPTDKGKDFVKLKFRNMSVSWDTLKLADITSIEVTNVSKPSKVMGQKRCTAEFTYRYKATPFGEIYLSHEELSRIYKKTAIFILSKDGWNVSTEGLSDW
jgi:hypothetical protein